MVQCSPPVAVNDVDIGLTIEDGVQNCRFLELRLFGQHGLMDWCLRLDRCLGVDVFAAVDEVD